MKAYIRPVVSILGALLVLLPVSVEARQPTASSVTAIAWNFDSSTVAIGYQSGEVCIWDTQVGNCIQQFQDHSNRVNQVTFSHDGLYFASSSFDGTISIRETNEWQIFSTLDDFTDYPGAIGWLLDNTSIISAGDDTGNSLRVWNITDGSLIQAGSTSNAFKLQIDAGGSHIAILTGVVQIVDAGTLLPIAALSDGNVGYPGSDGQENWITAFDWHPQLQIISTGTLSGKLQLWDVDTASTIITFDNGNTGTIEPTDRIDATSFNSDGTILYAISAGGLLNSWDVITGNLLDSTTVGDFASPGAFDPSGSQLVYVGTGGSLHIVSTYSSSPTCDPSLTITNGDTAALISATTTANGTPEPDTICLAEGGTYTFTAAYSGSNALPQITSEITIEGSNATLTRDVGASNFRLIQVDDTGTLTLNDLTLSNGDDNNSGWRSLQLSFNRGMGRVSEHYCE